MATTILKYPWFGPYILELSRYFKTIFEDFQVTAETDPITPQVLYGTPYAAYRKNFDTSNNRMVMPVINFYIADSTRKFEKEPSRNSFYIYNETIAGDTEVLRTSPPAHYEVNYQVYIWNNNLRERDAFLHHLTWSFPRNEVSLVHYPNPVQCPDDGMLMPFKVDVNFNDETIVEGLDPKDTRDKIITMFTMKGDSVILDAVSSAQTISTVTVEETKAFDPEILTTHTII